METTETTDFLTSMARRMVSWGSVVIAISGWVFAVNAALDDQFIGAGVCMAASALALGVLAYAFLRKQQVN